MVLFGAWQPRDWTSVLHHNPIWSRVDFLDFFKDFLDTNKGWEGTRCSGGNVCICCVKTPWSEDNVFIVLTSYFMGNLSYSSPRWKHRYFASLHPSASAYRISHQMKISKCILIPPRRYHHCPTSNNYKATLKYSPSFLDLLLSPSS